MVENAKNDPNLQNRSDFWLVGEARHEIRGEWPYGNLWARGGGAENGQFRGPKTPKMGENRKNEITLQIFPVFW